MFMATASLLNSSDSEGLFGRYLVLYRVIIEDEVSQTPESVLAVTAFLVPGNISNLYRSCDSVGVDSCVMSPELPGDSSWWSWSHKHSRQLAPLLTAFRPHPALNEPNRLI